MIRKKLISFILTSAILTSLVSMSAYAAVNEAVPSDTMLFTDNYNYIYSDDSQWQYVYFEDDMISIINYNGSDEYVTCLQKQNRNMILEMSLRSVTRPFVTEPT